MREPVNYRPAEHLRSFILSYGILTVPEGVSEPYFSPPIGLSGFIIHTVNTQNVIVAKIGENDHFTENAVATGQVTQLVHGVNIGQVRMLLVFFHPMGMYQLFGNDLAMLTNTSMPLKEFLGKQRADDLLKNLLAKQEDEHQVKALNDFFSSQEPIQNELTTRFRKLLDFIHHKKGDVNIKELEETGFYHRKTLERHFRKMVGISPKVYCQIYRFRCLMNLIQSQPDITWAQLAVHAGYYDQAHLSRYVKDYLNVSPNCIVKLEMQLINYLLNR
ncbi:AraC family transcriptional regulator [uncultured Sunxiuqinia sp.]|jgi:AraC-like DNA-binding protein|uniref:AraC family transcriptional regulator n=1 Tax=uncultured Sunxiuqinia sp. TaxID=1573825 RepID=UPI0030DA311F|tara:strand:- start:3457 stop:4278 length:822 start_codon:yes stop_codon:yes gene_type:complete